ncbi:alpha-2-macroglobulin-like protein 1 [Pelodytes ibericus]
MLHQGLCLVLILLQLWTLEAKLRYAVTFPSVISSPSPQLACLHIEGANGESAVQLTLSTANGNTTLVKRNFNQDSLFSCVPFKVPGPSVGDEEEAKLNISIQSQEDEINEVAKVLLRKERSQLLMQTDKPVYKPGQNVKFRIVSLKENLQPDLRQISMVELQDPEKNRIGQWLNVSLDQGMAELSLNLSPEPILGEYSIKAESKTHSFNVEEYVLPRFKVTLELPEVINLHSERLAAKICGRYTYGKPVQGTYECKVCKETSILRHRPFLGLVPEQCEDTSGQLDRSGCSSIELIIGNLTKVSHVMVLKGTASITEEGTGIQLSASSKTMVLPYVEKVLFVDAEKTYKAGIPYSAKIKVEDQSRNPIPDKKVFVTWKDKEEKLTLVTDRNGQASFTLENTTNWEGQIVISATLKEDHSGYVYLYLSPFYSKSKSLLKLHSLDILLPCEGQQEVQVDYIIKDTEVDSKTDQLNIHYMVVSKGSIWDSGTIAIKTTDEGLVGTTSFKLHLIADAAEEVHGFVYILLPGGEIVADSAKFKVQRCFKNKVSVGFSPDEVLPGSDVTLQIQAASGSLCGLRVVDQSVVLMKPERELTADKVHNLFPSISTTLDYRPRCRSSAVSRSFFHRITRPRSHSAWRHVDGDIDVYSLLKGVCRVLPVSVLLLLVTAAVTSGPQYVATPNWVPKPLGMHLKMITSADIQKPCNDDDEPFVQARRISYRKQNEQAENVNDVKDVEKVEIVRQYFPETWIWELVTVGDSGSAELHHTAPDTITDWNAGALCMGPSGFGLSASASLRVFQPFFVDLTLPYSVVRGESFTLKANVFNYLKGCIKVQTTLKPSEELVEEPCPDCQRSRCLCSEESQTFYWNLKATKLGEVNITVRTEALDTQDLCNNDLPIVPKQGSVDTVIKPLLVQPGGVLEEKSHSSLLCTENQDQSKTEVITLKVPENILKDSERAHVTILGDLMGTAMQNLDRLLAMPYGCGEQNMVLFVPNILILQYLEKTQQLSIEIQRKAKKFLESGYQRQLTYKHDDGSYSAFGKSDKEGNTWLTAFVVKSFSKASPYIFVDEKHLNHSFLWLKNHRQSNGCFRSVGKLFNNAMKGGVDDEISLSAYVTIALLESGMPRQDPLVRDAISCLGKAAMNVSSVYTQALLAYTFTLSGETDLRQILMEKLEEQAVRSAGQLHWERKAAPRPSESLYWYRAPSAEVELTSYMLLTFLSGPEKDLGTASEIVNWLSKQQNPYGGFSSTQDTVVALQALAKYAEATFSDTGDVTVTLSSQTGVMEFQVDNTNRLLLQRMPMPDIPGEYSLNSMGKGCVYVQTVLRYNVPPPRSDATFAIKVEIKPEQCPEGPAIELQIHITAEYTGTREKSNMALIEVKMLSGFIPVKSSVRQLEKSKVIQRSEMQMDIVTLYLDELGHKPVELSFTVEQDIEVKNLKPATVRVYDYYEIEESAIAEYTSPCSSDGQRGNAIIWGE